MKGISVSWVERFLRSDRLKAALVSRRLPWVLALVAMAVTTPSLLAGFYQDDHLIRLRFQNFEGLPGIEGRLFDTCTFGDGNPEQTLARMERGIVPWWGDPEWKVAFGRPLIGLSHYIDWLLFGDNAFAMHAHNILWYGALVLLITLLYRRLLSPGWVAGLAAFMFAIDATHAIPVGWIATRNAPLSSVFIVLIIYLHDRWRRDGWRPGQWLALLCLAVGLLGSEATVASGAYLAGHALFIDRDGNVAKRFARLLPYLAVVIVWRVWYDAQGYGVHGTMLYTDPLTQPILFLEEVVHYLPLLLFGMFGAGDPAVGVFLPQPWMAIVYVAVLGALAFVGWMLWPLLKRDATARFWATGMVLSALPICTTIPQIRELMNPSIGAFALIALFLGRLAERERAGSTRYWAWAGRLAGVWIVFHLIVSLLSTPVLAYSGTVMPESIARRVVDTAPKDGAFETLVIVYAPADLIGAVLPIMRAVENEYTPLYGRTLCAGVRTLDIERRDEQTLVLRPDDTFLKPPFCQVFRNPELNPMKPGDTVKLTNMTATVEEVTEDGRPNQIAFHFNTPLEHPTLRWVAYDKTGKYAPFKLPAIGEKVTITGPTMVDVAKSWFLGEE